MLAFSHQSSTHAKHGGFTSSVPKEKAINIAAEDWITCNFETMSPRIEQQPASLPCSPVPSGLQTPCARESTSPWTPPPLERAGLIPKPLLLSALEAGSVEQVRKVLQADAEVANDLFWDHHAEPPLCAAVRLECSADIIRLLLEYKADMGVRNAQGRTPLEILHETSHAQPGFPQQPPFVQLAPLSFLSELPFATWLQDNPQDGLGSVLTLPFAKTIPTGTELCAMGPVDLVAFPDVNTTASWRREVAAMLQGVKDAEGLAQCRRCMHI